MLYQVKVNGKDAPRVEIKLPEGSSLADFDRNAVDEARRVLDTKDGGSFEIEITNSGRTVSLFTMKLPLRAADPQGPSK